MPKSVGVTRKDPSTRHRRHQDEKFAEKKFRKIKGEGQRIPRKLEYRRKVRSYEHRDDLIRAKRERVLDPGTLRKGQTVQSQYFRTGLARSDILKPTKRSRYHRQPETGKMAIHQNRPPKRTGDPIHRRTKPKTTSDSRVPKTKVPRGDVTNAKRRPYYQKTTDQNRPSQMRKSTGQSPEPKQKLEKGPVSGSKRETYAQIRDRFEKASGGATFLQLDSTRSQHGDSPVERKVPLIGLAKPQRRHSGRKTTSLVHAKPDAEDTSGDEDESKRTATPKPKKIIGGIKLVGLDSVARKASVGERTTPLQPETPKKRKAKESKRGGRRAKSKTKEKRHSDDKKAQKDKTSKKKRKLKVEKNKLESDEKQKEYKKKDRVLLRDKKKGTLIARRIRRVPDKGSVKYRWVVEEIHELPPLLIRKSELHERFREMNADKFDELLRPHPRRSTKVRIRNAFQAISPMKIVKKIREKWKKKF